VHKANEQKAAMQGTLNGKPFTALRDATTCCRRAGGAGAGPVFVGSLEHLDSLALTPPKAPGICCGSRSAATA